MRRPRARGLLLGVLALAAGCSDGATTSTSITTITTIPVTTVPPSGELVAVRATVRSAVQALAAAPGVEITGTDSGEGNPTSIRIVTDTAAEAFDSLEQLGAGLEYHRVLVDGQLYVRVETNGDDQTWSASPIDAPAYFAGAFTYHGRVFDDLSALVSVVDTVGFSVERLAPRDVEGRPATGYRLTAPAPAVLDALLRLGLVATEGAELGPTPEAVSLTLWVTDLLVGLDASGSVFHDGEAVPGTLSLRFRPLPTAGAVTVPRGHESDGA